MANALDPVLFDTPIAGNQMANESWLTWFYGLFLAQNSTPHRYPPVAYVAQAAAIGATPVPTGALSGGYYRVTWYARLVRAASTSSALTVTIGWTDKGQPVTVSGAALTGNTTDTMQSGSVLVRSDAPPTITVATAYASVGAVTMAYDLSILVEAL